MKNLLLNKIRLSWYLIFFLVLFTALVSVIPRTKFDAGALTLFSVNSFLYGFYIAPILGGQKSRIEELHRIARAETNALFALMLQVKGLPQKPKTELKQMFGDYITLVSKKRSAEKSEEKYEEIYIDGYLLPNVWGFIKSPEFEKVDIQNVFWLDFSYLYFIRSKLLINDEDIELFNSIISSVNFMFYMKDMKEVTITDYLVIFNKIIEMEDQLNQNESLVIINQMINKARNQFTENGHLYLLWGWLILICSIGHFVMQNILHLEQFWMVWMLTWAGVIYQVIYISYILVYILQ